MNASNVVELSTARLLVVAREAGFEVSENQLRRWRQRGLLPRPKQLHRAGLHGSVTMWPPGTETHLVALCGLAKRFRRLNDLLLATWWEGWPVARAELLREFGHRLAAYPFVPVDANMPEDRRLDAVDEMVATVNMGRLGRPLRSLLRRVGTNDADRKSLLTALMSIAIGIEPPVEAVDVGLDERSLGDLLATALGLDGFATQLTDVGDPATSGELVDNVVALATQLPAILGHAGAVIAAGDLDELCAARDQARRLGEIAGFARAGILPVQDGLGYMAGLIVSDDPDGWVLAVTAVLWRRMTAPEELRTLVAEVEKNAPVAAVVAAVPGLLDLHNQADADPHRVHDLVQAHPDIAKKLNEYLAEHPDLARQPDALL